MSSYHCKFDFPGHRIVPCADCQQPKCQTCDIFHWSFFCNRKICINCAVQPKYQSDVHTIQELQALQQEELLVEEPRGFFEEAKQGDQAVPGSRENPHVFEEEEPKEEEEEEEELKEEPEPPDTCCICMEEYESENRNRYIFPCSHSVCTGCFERGRLDRCPMCRTAVSASSRPLDSSSSSRPLPSSSSSSSRGGSLTFRSSRGAVDVPVTRVLSALASSSSSSSRGGVGVPVTSIEHAHCRHILCPRASPNAAHLSLWVLWSSIQGYMSKSTVSHTHREK